MPWLVREYRKHEPHRDWEAPGLTREEATIEAKAIAAQGTNSAVIHATGKQMRIARRYYAATMEHAS